MRRVGALLLEPHERWFIMSLETLAPLGDTPPCQPAAGGSLTRGPARPG